MRGLLRHYRDRRNATYLSLRSVGFNLAIAILLPLLQRIYHCTLPVIGQTAILILLPCIVSSADYYDWNIRLDRDGKPAGHFETTPFPIDETMTQYSITNDEGTKTYQLGTIVFADNGAIGCGNGSIDYDPFTRVCGEGARTVYTNISGAINALSAGNRTILVRDGTYAGKIRLKSGLNAAQRFSVIGYKQERPIITYHNLHDKQSAVGTSGNYTTLQRVAVTNSLMEGVYTASIYEDFNGIDLYIYGNSHYLADEVTSANGNFYIMGTNNSWAYHITSAYTAGHCIKVGGFLTQNVIVEWSKAWYCGWWPGVTESTTFDHSTGLDLVGDGISSGQSPSSNITGRYNIIHDSLAYCGQIRATENFSVHHNEFYNCPHFEIPGKQEHTLGEAVQVLIYGDSYPHYGSLYGNVLRDAWTHDPTVAGSRNTYNLWITGVNNPTSRGINIYNNLIYQTGDDNGTLVSIGSGQANLALNLYNNTFVSQNSETQVIDHHGAIFENNIFVQGGSGACVDYTAETTANNNLYYHPSGTRGYTGVLEAGGKKGDPILDSNYYLRSTSPAINAGADLSHIFTTDKDGVLRPPGQWSIGAYQYRATRKVPSGNTVKLDGTDGVDPSKTYAYMWAQILGPTVQLSEPKAAKPEFAAPVVNQETEIVFTVVVNDGLVDGTPKLVSVTVVPPNVSALSLVKGWNFISFPREPSNGQLSSVFGDAYLKVKSVWGYDNQTKGWMKYKPGDESNSLSTIQAGSGYWVYMDETAEILLSGTDVSSAVPLYPGWNLVGFLALNGNDLSSSMNGLTGKWDAIWTWENSQWHSESSVPNPAPPFPLIKNLFQGKAYWIKIKPGAGEVQWGR